MLVTQPMPIPVWMETTLREHGPRIDPEARLDRERAPGTVEDEADEELEDAAKHVAIQSDDWTAVNGPIRLLWPHGLPHLRSCSLAALGGWRTREPAYEALADGIRLLCLDNRLAPRTALPAERELAAPCT